jgi:hypothetical protein
MSRPHDDMMQLQAVRVNPRGFEVIRVPVIMLYGVADPHLGRMIRASLEPYMPQIEYVEWEPGGPCRPHERSIHNVRKNAINSARSSGRRRRPNT